MNSISFVNPYLLFLLLPLVAIVVVPFAIAVRRDNVNAHNITSLVIQLIMCVTITLAFAGMTFERVITETNVYVLADISYSADDNLDKVQENVKKISQKLPRNSKMGVICFGRNYKLLSGLGDPVPDVRKADGVDRSATDIASALRYAGNLFEDDVIKRIIIITDGAETVTTNNIVRVVSSLQDSGVYVDAVYMDNNIKAETKEVQIDGADCSPATYLNKEEEVSVLVRANCGEEEGARIDGYVTLLKDGAILERRTVSFYSGLNSVILPLSTDTAGTFRYELRVDAVAETDDTSGYNNVYSFSQTVSAERRVLVIGGAADDATAAQAIYGTDNVTYITDPTRVPITVEELCVYDEIVLSNFDVRRVTGATMFMKSLSTLVDDYGKTLATYGNTYVQEDDGENGETPLTILADLLPVKIGNNDTDKRLVAIVLDISISMNFNSRFAVAKNTAIEFLKVLNPTDTVMVVGFSGGVTELLPPTPLTVPGVIIDRINKCSAENGTNLSAALTHTYNLMPSNFHDKQVVIISDGMNPQSDEAGTKEIARKMSSENIAVSAIGIYPDDYGNGLLRKIVFDENPNATERSFYKVIEHESEIDITLKDLNEETRQIRIEGERYTVKIRSENDKSVEGVSALNPVWGFWYNSAKSTANTVLTATYFRDRVQSFDVPLYAYWQSGKGKVYSFTSDISGDWTFGFIAGDGRKFYENIAGASLPSERIVSPFIVDVEEDGGTATVLVNASSSLQNIPNFTITVTDPRGLVTSDVLSFNSSAYMTQFNVDVPGTYAVHLEYSNGNKAYTADTEFSVPYYAEYDAFAAYSKSLLYRLITEYGDIINPDEVSALENSSSAYLSYVLDLTLPLMVLCALLFVAEIIIRQLRWKDVTSFFKGLFGRRS